MSTTAALCMYLEAFECIFFILSFIVCDMDQVYTVP